ncbi:MAG: hypothetical protein JNG89_06750 [Planctomycetaceae bacterium]|nr:hypothetical protein [Planctomycetaceae bacterium]
MAPSSPTPGSQPASPPAGPAKKPRSPAEKVIVWGGIAVMLLVLAYQARARVGYNTTLNALEARLAQDEGIDAKPLLEGDLDSYIVGWPSRKVEEKSQHLKTVELTWPGLTAPFVMTVMIDPSEEGGSVMAVQTAGYVEPPPPEREDRPMTAEEVAAFNASIPPGANGKLPMPGEEAAAEPAADGKADAPVAEEPATAEPAAEAPAATAEPAPATEAPAAEAPAVEAPAAETPATEAPAAETPAAETPAETPAATEPATGN